jgi:hypothetical protein
LGFDAWSFSGAWGLGIGASGVSRKDANFLLNLRQPL